MELYERIFVALDDLQIEENRKIVDALKGKVGGFKIGLRVIIYVLSQLVCINRAVSRRILHDFQDLIDEIGTHNLFLDLKLSDIPEVMSGAMVGWQARFCTVHGNSGPRSIRAAVEKRGNTQILGVTLPTSFDTRETFQVYEAYPETIVLRLARLLVESGVDGLVCSAQDLKVINRDKLIAAVPKMTPGIRPAWAGNDDQARVMTPAEAIANGATWIVIGRPITQYAAGPLEAIERILEEMNERSEA